MTSSNTPAMLPSAPPMAAPIVFGIAELIEMILLQLSPREILVAMTVATSWKNTMQTSRAIQMKLYLRPKPKKRVWITARDQWNQRSISSIQAHARSDEIEDDGLYAIDGTFNELILQQRPAWRLPRMKRELSMRMAFGERLLLVDRLQERLRDLECKLSCDNMFLTQPPTRKAWLSCWCRPPNSDGLNWSRREVEIVNEGGLRLSDIRREHWTCGCDLHIVFPGIRRPRGAEAIVFFDEEDIKNLRAEFPNAVPGYPQ